MIFILNRGEEVVGVLHNNGDTAMFYEDTHTEDLDTGSETFEFTAMGDTQEAYYLQVGNYVAFKDENDFKVFTITEVEEEHDEYLSKRVYCEGICLELLNEVIRPVEMPSVNMRQFLTTVLNDTTWSVGMIDVALSDSHAVDLTDYSTVYSAIQNIACGTFGAEIRFRIDIKNNRIVAKYIDAFSQRGRVTKHRFEYGRNLSNVKRTVDTSELCTALIGVGNNDITFKEVQADDKPLNQDFIIDQDAYDRWNNKGSHIMGVYKTDTDSPQELLKLTRKELQRRSTPKITYEVDVEMLGDDVKLGDEVFIIDTDFNPQLLLSARVSVLEKTKTNGSNKCTLANFKEVRSNITDDMRNLASELEGKLDEKLNAKFPVGTEDIKDDAITSDKIGSNQVYGSHIYADQISTQHLQADSITAEKIQAEAINSKHIEAEAITTDHLTANIISGDKALIEEGYITTAHIGRGEIQEANIGNAVIDSVHIKSGAIDSVHITEGSIGTAHIQDASIKSAQIGSAQITNAHIKDLSADKITTGTLDATKVTVKDLSADSITSGTIDANLINVTNIDASNITSGTISADRITGLEITADKITTGTLDASRVDVINLDADNITSGTIDANLINVSNINASNITSGTIDASRIAVTNLDASNITSGKISADRIEGLSLEVADGSITTAKIKDASITSAKIQSGAIGTAHIVDGAISSAKISNASITDAKIQDATITSAKIKELNANKITSGTIDTGKITVSGTGGKLKINNNRLQVFDASTTPKERVSLGDVNNDGSVYGLRVRGADGNTILYDENGVYTEGITDGAITNEKIGDQSVTADKLVIEDIFADTGFIGALSTVSLNADQITTGKISGDRIDLEGLISFDALDNDLQNNFTYDRSSNKTFINGGNIYSKSVTAEQIYINGLSVSDGNNNVTFSISQNGDADIKGTISSYEFSDEVGKEKGYKLNPNGDAILNNATVRGSVILPNGGITDFGGDRGLSNINHVRIWAGASYENRDTAPFRVLQDGTVIATKGEFNGTVTGSLDIGNIKIEDTNNSNGSITVSTNNNAKEVIKLNEDLSFINTNFIIGNSDNKMVDFDINNNKVDILAKCNMLTGSQYIKTNGASTQLMELGYLKGTYGDYKHEIKYSGGGLVYNNIGAIGTDVADYKFSRNDGSGSVEVAVEGNLSVKNKITMNDKIEMISRTSTGNSGFDFVIK